MLRKDKKIFFLCLTYLLLTAILVLPIHSYISVPNQQIMAVGDSLSLGLPFPDTLISKLSVNCNDKLQAISKNISLNKKNNVIDQPGHFNLRLMLFGLIPIKTINVNVVPTIELYPGGQAVGALLRTQGVLIVGYSPVVDKQSKTLIPAKNAGIEIGDSIVAVNNTILNNDEELSLIINEAGRKNEKLTFTLKHNNDFIKRTIKPIYCSQTNCYRIGLLVKDNAGGVGTLTFYDPKTNKYGALGHMISDVDTNQQIIIKNGRLIKAFIEGIQIGKRGYPGEKIGTFIKNTDLGNIMINSYCGIFGEFNKNNIQNNYFNKPLPVGFSHQIKTGPAEILTVLKGEKIEKFSINVDKVMLGRDDGKEMVIRITDPRLLRETGGIVQGMSGSPIIQDGKLIGAVTHVFVNDPTRGYAVFIEDMLIESGILSSKEDIKLGA